VPEIILPPGVDVTRRQETGSVLIDNRTDLPDGLIEAAVESYFVENAALVGANMANTFQTYASEGSLLARSKFRTPASVYDEIELARDLSERDDDVRAVMRSMTSVAFSDGMENHHPDEQTVKLFNGLARYMNLDRVLKRAAGNDRLPVPAPPVGRGRPRGQRGDDGRAGRRRAAGRARAPDRL
jgi:hypothetical protein